MGAIAVLLGRILSNGDAIHFDIERSRPCGNADKDSSGRVLGKVPSVDRVDCRKFLDRRAIHVALKNVFQRRSRRLEAKLHLFQNKVGLALNWGFNYLSGVGVEWRKPGDVDRIAASSNG